MRRVAEEEVVAAEEEREEDVATAKFYCEQKYAIAHVRVQAGNQTEQQRQQLDE